MKKWWFIAAIVFYGGMGILGLKGNSYTEETSFLATVNKNMPLLVIAAIIIGGIFFYFFTKIFPKGYTQQNQVARLFIPVVFMILSFALNRAWLQIINEIGEQQSLILNGHIYAKRIERSGKTNFYYVVLVDSVTENQYTFKVKKPVYEGLGNNGDIISKKFLIGSLGIIYRAKP